MFFSESISIEHEECGKQITIQTDDETLTPVLSKEEGERNLKLVSKASQQESEGENFEQPKARKTLNLMIDEIQENTKEDQSIMSSDDLQVDCLQNLKAVAQAHSCLKSTYLQVQAAPLARQVTKLPCSKIPYNMKAKEEEKTAENASNPDQSQIESPPEENK